MERAIVELQTECDCDDWGMSLSDRVPEAYRNRWERFVAVKMEYDPGNCFRMNQNISQQKKTAGNRTVSKKPLVDSSVTSC